ncbi:MAG TPA: Hsp20/alpha crystallin family protein [Chthoniobacterales bacterium]|nr:Hsp20/alpha crystallin family protein [Chthoniobacterales bacterium]
MQTLTTWTPFKELDELENRLGTFFRGFPIRGRTGNGETLALPKWSPQVDISEDDKEYLVKADLPEVKKEDVKVTFENGLLSISGERKTEKEEKKKTYHRVERSYGTFERVFTLPEDADATKIGAEFKEGVLRVHLPKSPSAKPKTVEVKVA